MIEVVILSKRPFFSKQTIAEKLLLSKKISSESGFRIGWNFFLRKATPEMLLTTF